MLVIAVRSFGIIGADAVLFPGTPTTGIQTLAAVGEEVVPSLIGTGATVGACEYGWDLTEKRRLRDRG